MIYSGKTIKWVQNGFTILYVNQKPYFIHGALPDEEIEFKILKENNQHGFGVVKEILQKNPQRIESDCKIFTICGGCSFRHIEYHKEIEIKINLLKEFNELKSLIENQNYDYYFSPENQYRNQVRFHVDKEKKGFYQLFSNEIISIPDEGCRNLPDELNQYIKNYHNKNKQFKDIKLFFLHNNVIENQNFKIKINKNTEWELSPNCFLQTNRFLLREWLDWIKKEVLSIIQNKIHSLKILELFCGTGIISSSMIETIEFIKGYESNPEAIHLAKKNYNRYKIKNEFIFRDLYKHGIEKNDDYNIIIINPPRKGMGKILLNQFRNINIPIIYSSCNPATFNRDAHILKQYGYKIKHFAIFDFFPRTFHLEIVASFIKVF